MRRPAQRVQRSAIAITKSLPAPVKGWNARDSVADMDRLDAALLKNWWPTTSDVELRKGSAEHATDADPVVTLMPYRPPSGTQELFAATADGIYDVSVSGAVGAAEVGSLASGQWQYQNFATSGGNFLLAVNGADDMLHYDGSTWVAIDGASTPAITNVATDDLIGLTDFKERMFYIEKSSLNLWYSAAGAFAGALTKLPLQAVFKKGGYIMAAGSWSVDGGQGMDDLLVIISSEGEAVVFAGTNPASSSTWSQVGLYAIGKPIGRKCMMKLGSDLLIITTDGVVPASKALVKNRSDSAVAITDRIQGAMARAVRLFGNVPGWSLTHYPEGSVLILAIPVGDGLQEQFVMNTITKAWANFTGWPATCFETIDGSLYFGTADSVREAWTGTADMGEPIVCELVQAFSELGTADLKKVELLLPLMSWDSNPVDIRIGVDVDYQIRTPTVQIGLPADAGGEWDGDDWDETEWLGDPTIKRNWYTVPAVGNALALHLLIQNVSALLALSATVYKYTRGTGL